MSSTALKGWIKRGFACKKKGLLFCVIIVSGTAIYFHIETGNRMEPHAVDDLGVKYNKAYGSYIERHEREYPDCTQSEMLDADAKRHAQYQVDLEAYQQKHEVLDSELQRVTEVLKKRYHMHAPRKLRMQIRRFEESFLDSGGERYREELKRVYRIRDSMSRGDRRRLYRRLRLSLRTSEKIIKKLGDLREPVEPEPGHPHEHSVERYIARHRLRYPHCTSVSVHRDAELDTNWRIESQKWQEKHDAFRAEIEGLGKENRDYIEKMRETFKALTDAQKKKKTAEMDNWSEAWRERLDAAHDKMSRHYGQKPVKPSPLCTH